ncbi:hypothetical protein G7Z17_g4095 [Cylindrodendrum hubeiense]|uniref:Beta-lactamase-related domain-containing protein n=1 Tax=Cylindrodendrum hubeiense TaxID=595255 RepID=A0A9P5HEJ5_9HYPO|nr:hypothetical protein G7Z17_g4095 [Cylindrodendrum hubeiense]
MESIRAADAAYSSGAGCPPTAAVCYLHEAPANQVQHPSRPPMSSPAQWSNNQADQPYQHQPPALPQRNFGIPIAPQQVNPGGYNYYPSSQPAPASQSSPLQPTVPPRPPQAPNLYVYEAPAYPENRLQQPIPVNTIASNSFEHSRGSQTQSQCPTSTSAQSSDHYVAELSAGNVSPAQLAGFQSNVNQLSTPPAHQSSGQSFGCDLPEVATPPTEYVSGLMPLLSNLSINPPATTIVSVPKYDEVEFPYLISSEPRLDGEPNEVLQECPKSRQVDYKTFWYCLQEAPGSLICTHCYYKFISATSLRGAFQKVEKTSGRCRFNIHRILLYIWPEAQRRQSTHALSEFMTRRLTIPDCKGWSGTMLKEGIKFFSPTSSSPKGFVVCEACYEDEVLDSPFAGYFAPTTSVLGPTQKWYCCFSGALVGRLFRKYSTQNGGWDQWTQEAEKRIFMPICDGKTACSAAGSKGGSFYRLRGPAVDFCVCVVCFSGILQSMRVDRYFELANYDPKDTIVCSLTPGAPRFAEYIRRLSEAYETGVWSRFSTFVHKWASVPVCSMDTLGPGIFYGFSEGFPDIAACQQCYEEVIQRSRFDPMVVRRGETQLNGGPLKAICSFFSPRMRLRWTTACASGDFDGFMEFAKLRVKVWCETIPRMQMILAQQKMTQQRAMTSALASVAYQGMENIKLAASGYRSDRLYGSSSLGWHETQNGAISARYNQDAMAGSAQVEDLMNQHHVPGLAIAIVQGDEVASEGYGKASIEPPIPCTSDTLFDFASCAKSLTAASVGLLVDDNENFPEVQYEAIMSNLLPDDFVMPGAGYTEGVTLEDVLSHRTGMAP